MAGAGILTEPYPQGFNAIKPGSARDKATAAAALIAVTLIVKAGHLRVRAVCGRIAAPIRIGERTSGSAIVRVDTNSNGWPCGIDWIAYFVESTVAYFTGYCSQFAKSGAHSIVGWDEVFGKAKRIILTNQLTGSKLAWFAQFRGGAAGNRGANAIG